MTERKYTATIDTGRDYIEFNYTSTHRNRSRENKEDCKQQLVSKYGRHTRYYEIVSTYRFDWEN